MNADPGFGSAACEGLGFGDIPWHVGTSLVSFWKLRKCPLKHILRRDAHRAPRLNSPLPFSCTAVDAYIPPEGDLLKPVYTTDGLKQRWMRLKMRVISTLGYALPA
jgi:hypothetical protein